MDMNTYTQCKDAKWGIIEGKNIVAGNAEKALEFLTEEEHQKIKDALELIDSVCFGLEMQMSNLRS